MSVSRIFPCPIIAFFLAGAVAAGAAAPAMAKDGAAYQVHALVSDGASAADHTDPNLVNAWGVAFNPFGFVWVANNHTGTATLYDGTGNPQSLVVAIPNPAGASGGSPTGIVYSASNAFTVSNGAATGPSRFLFATEDGVIAGWAPNVDLAHAQRAVDNSASGAIYKGIALSAGGAGQLLYATDFHNGKVDVFDSKFMPVNLPAGAFVDARIPYGFAPFGIQAINGDIYVTYAKQDADRHDDVHGPGLGYVDAYDPNGKLLRRVASRGPLNAPWGVALAPAGFGRLGGSLLVGNFGDGRINAYDPTPNLFAFGLPLGNLRDSQRRPIEIDGLWGIAFGSGFANQPVDTLFFAAGPGNEAHGAYGRIDAVAPGDDSDD
ncbi:MAG: TIGR03118 family protein [Proteobacteria bacterium]|nr:TIGR03118 family protein [Pseudomonadota bacterium]